MPIRNVTLYFTEFSGRFDKYYDDGFKWDSERGYKTLTLLKSKQLYFVRHTESQYQVIRDAKEWSEVRHMEQLQDPSLTTVGVMQAAGVGHDMAQEHIRPDLIVSSPLTRCLQTAALAFPDVFLSNREDCTLQMCSLLPEKVDSYGDCERRIATVIEEKPELYLFEHTMSQSCYQKKNQDDKLDQIYSPRWELATDDKNEFPFPSESKESARKRVALFWRWLAERPEQVIAVVTHSKLVKKHYQICMLGNSVEEFHNGDCIHVVFDAYGFSN